MRLRLSIVLLAIGATASPSAAGERESARGVGMARTFVASARGLDAVGINPANLDPGNGDLMQIDFLPIGVHVGSDFLNYDLYTSYFTGVKNDSGKVVGRHLTDQDKQRILDAFPGGNGLISTNADFRWFGAALALNQIGTFSFTLSEHVGGMLNIPRDFLALILNGNLPGSTLDFSNTNVKGAWTREYALSYARTIPHPPFLKSLRGGVTFKVVHGFAYFDVERFNASLATATNGTLTGGVDLLARTSKIDALRDSSGGGNYSPFGAPAGSAFAMDLGVAGSVNEFLSFGLSITDMGSMTWTSNVRLRSVDTTLVIDDLFATSQRDALENSLSAKEQPTGAFSSQLPTQFRLGFAVEIDKIPTIVHFPGQLTVALDYNQGFHDTYASTTHPRISLGAEYLPISWIPIRSGVSFGGTDRVNMAFGFGLHFGGFQFDIASENVSWLFDPKSFSYGSIAMGMRFSI